MPNRTPFADPPHDLRETRASLLVRMRDWQDRASWQQFFDTYWKLIYGVARRSDLTDTEAQDVVSEVMASVAKHIPTFRYDPAKGSFKSWLMVMTRWRIISHLRKRGPLDSAQALADDPGSDAPEAEVLADPNAAQVEVVWDLEWQRNLLDAALNRLRSRLDPEKLQIFDFYVRKEWPAGKVAAHFGVPIEQVYLAKHRISEALRAEVERLERETT